MTLLGKVFTGLIFVFSVAFFCLSLAVNASHNNWQDAVMNPQNGYKVQNQRLKDGNQQLKDQLNRANQEYAQEQAARRSTIAALQTQFQQIKTELEQKSTELDRMQAANTEMNQALASTQDQLKKASTENEQLKLQVNDIIKDRNNVQRRIAALTDELNQLVVTYNTLKKEKDELDEIATVTDAKLRIAQNTLTSAGIRENLDGGLPNDLRGVILAVGNDGMVEVSLGRDDGVREGDHLDVYRGGHYLGKIEIRRTQDDKSVGKILPGFRKGFIQQGDKVSSKLG